MYTAQHIEIISFHIIPTKVPKLVQVVPLHVSQAELSAVTVHVGNMLSPMRRPVPHTPPNMKKGKNGSPNAPACWSTQVHLS